MDQHVLLDRFIPYASGSNFDTGERSGGESTILLVSVSNAKFPVPVPQFVELCKER